MDNFNPLMFPRQIPDGAIDAAAYLISWESPPEDILVELRCRGLDNYQAYLAYQAAKVLIKMGFYEVIQQPKLYKR